MKEQTEYTPDEIKKELKKKPKYNNTKIILSDGTVVDSKLENKHKQNFERLLAEGSIRTYKWQVPIELLPTFKHKGETIKSMKYIADHYVIDNKGIITVYDSKGFQTDVSKIKIKLFKYVYPDINFKLLRAPVARKKEDMKTKKGLTAKPNLFSSL